VIGVKLPVVADLRVEKFKILKKAVKKLEKDGIKEALARNGIKPETHLASGFTALYAGSQALSNRTAKNMLQ